MGEDAVLHWNSKKATASADTAGRQTMLRPHINAYNIRIWHFSCQRSLWVLLEHWVLAVDLVAPVAKQFPLLLIVSELIIDDGNRKDEHAFLCVHTFQDLHVLTLNSVTLMLSLQITYGTYWVKIQTQNLCF